MTSLADAEEAGNRERQEQKDELIRIKKQSGASFLIKHEVTFILA